MANKKILLYGIGSLQNRGCEALVNSTITQFDLLIISGNLTTSCINKWKNKIKTICCQSTS